MGAEDTQVSDLVGGVWQPGRACFFESCLEDMTMAACDATRADRQTQRQGQGVVQAVQTMAQVAMSVAHGGFRFRGALGFQMLLQGGPHLGNVAALEPLLRRASPALRLIGTATRRGLSQIFADVKEVAQKVALSAEDLPALQPPPIRSISPAWRRLFNPQPAGRAQGPHRRPVSSTLPKVAPDTVVALPLACAA